MQVIDYLYVLILYYNMITIFRIYYYIFFFVLCNYVTSRATIRAAEYTEKKILKSWLLEVL